MRATTASSMRSSRATAPRLPSGGAGVHRPIGAQRATRVMVRATGAPEPAASAAAPQVEPSRHMALPNNAMWLLDFLQDKFYDVRGPNFVIQRAESEDDGTTTRRKAPRKTGPPVVQPGSSSAGSSNSSSSSRALSLINRVVHQYPGSIMLLEGAVVDMSEWLEPTDEQQLPEDSTTSTVMTMAANTTCTGIVRVEQQEEQEQEEDVFYNDSTSPRRTKRVGFTCKCCGARTYSNVNPMVFHAGTLVAQCAKCERWHKLSDHFGLFHHLQGPVLRGRPLVEVEDIPPSLRLRDEVEEGGEMW